MSNSKKVQLAADIDPEQMDFIDRAVLTVRVEDRERRRYSRADLVRDASFELAKSILGEELPSEDGGGL